MLKTKIRELRMERHMEQSELARLVDVRRETIGRLERGQYNPSLKLAMDIAKVFHTTVEDIFVFSVMRPTSSKQPPARGMFPLAGGCISFL